MSGPNWKEQRLGLAEANVEAGLRKHPLTRPHVKGILACFLMLLPSMHPSLPLDTPAIRDVDPVQGQEKTIMSP